MNKNLITNLKFNSGIKGDVTTLLIDIRHKQYSAGNMICVKMSTLRESQLVNQTSYGTCYSSQLTFIRPPSALAVTSNTFLLFTPNQLIQLQSNSVPLCIELINSQSPYHSYQAESHASLLQNDLQIATSLYKFSLRTCKTRKNMTCMCSDITR